MGREASDAGTDRFRRGSGDGTHGKRGMDATREALAVAWHTPTDSPRGSGRACRVAERPVVPGKPGKAGGGTGASVREQRMTGEGTWGLVRT